MLDVLQALVQQILDTPPPPPRPPPQSTSDVATQLYMLPFEHLLLFNVFERRSSDAAELYCACAGR